MIYVIDGHNLIGKLPGLSLDMLDDEAELLKRLQAYIRALRQRGRKVTIEVFFDKAALGHAGVRNAGPIHAHFVQSPMIADEAIRIHLVKLGGAARNVCVVSSDHQVQNNARTLHARVMSSEEFAQELAITQAAADAAAPSHAPASDGRNLDQWLDLFGLDAEEAERPIELKREKRVSRPPASGKPAPGTPARPKNKPGKARPHHGFEKKS